MLIYQTAYERGFGCNDENVVQLSLTKLSKVSQNSPTFRHLESWDRANEKRRIVLAYALGVAHRHNICEVRRV